ncbi:MAG TPA: ATP-dependent DNA helicase UvrD2 [Acidimicrobiia bacterium]
MSAVPGPAALGRGVVVARGDAVPDAWAAAEVVTVDDAVLADPGPAVAALHHAWVARRPFVVALGVEAERFRAPVPVTDAPWRLGARFEVWLDRLHFLVWANTYDARDGREPVWWWARKAARVGATETTGPEAGDVLLADGTAAWIDGGPRGPLDAEGLGAVVVHAETVELGRLTPEPPPRPVTAALAPDQLAAVAHGAGPARIVAPAGSGKTRVLTERLRHLVVDRGVEREAVLAVAYNKKAQLELEERTADFSPRVSTLNALGYRLLAEYHGTAPRVLDERDVRRMVDDLVPRGRPRANTDRLAPYLEGLTAIRLGLRDPETVEAERDDVPGLAEAFEPFRDALGRRGAVDFDDQVYGAVEALLTDGAFRRRAQAGYRHLLVDELQDLTPAHVLLLRLLAAPALDVFGVGDDDQVIYGHAGADPAFLIDFEQLFPGAASHPLEVNYRCPVTVVAGAKTLLGYNDVRVPKEIRPGPDADPDPAALTVVQHHPDAGASTLVETVQGWLADGVEPAQVAVLTRVNSLLLAPHVALVEAGVPVTSMVSVDVLERTGVRAALAYLRLGASPDAMQPDDLQEVQRRPSRGFPPWISKWLQRPMSIDDLRAISERIDDAKVGAKVEAFADDLLVVAEAVRTRTTREVLAVVGDEIGLGGAMTLLDGSKGGQSGSQLDDLDALTQVADLHPDPVGFERWLRGVLGRGGTRDDGGITLSTVHRVKGMEWDRVVVAGVTDGVLPHRLAEDEEEERRVLHVAITRCRHRVTVLADATRPSPFLGELDGSAPKRAPRPRQPREATPIPKAKGKGAPLADLAPEHARVEEALRAWRLERCRADDVPAYIVASNAVIRAIATRRPTSARELATVDGIGPTKLELYGDEILAVVDATSD